MQIQNQNCQNHSTKSRLRIRDIRQELQGPGNILLYLLNAVFMLVFSLPQHNKPGQTFRKVQGISVRTC